MILYTTIHGGIGALLPFTSKEDVSFCSTLVMIRQAARRLPTAFL